MIFKIEAFLSDMVATATQSKTYSYHEIMEMFIDIVKEGIYERLYPKICDWSAKILE